jgi:hypothetical protein
MKLFLLGPLSFRLKVQCRRTSDHSACLNVVPVFDRLPHLLPHRQQCQQQRLEFSFQEIQDKDLQGLVLLTLTTTLEPFHHRIHIDASRSRRGFQEECLEVICLPIVRLGRRFLHKVRQILDREMQVIQ